MYARQVAVDDLAVQIGRADTERVRFSKNQSRKSSGMFLIMPNMGWPDIEFSATWIRC